MKKAILAMASLPLLLLASCSDDEPVQTQNDLREEAISFRPAMSGRATEVTNANLPSVFVTSILNGQNYFTDLEFSKDNTGFYNSAKSYYWPGDTTTLQFYAYYPSQDVMGADAEINKDTKKITNFCVSDNLADQIDFITASATGTKAKNEASGVPLEFKHRLVQIEVRAKSANQTYKYTVAGVRLGRFEYKADFDFQTNQWTLDDWHDTQIVDASCDPVVLTADPVSIMGKDGNAMMMPQKLYGWNPTADPDNVARDAYISVLVNITSDTGVQIYPFPSDKMLDENGQKRQYAWAAIPLSGTLEQGKKYIYTLDFTNGAGNVDPDDPTPGIPVYGDPIKVVPKVEDWVDEPDIPMPMTPVK